MLDLSLRHKSAHRPAKPSEQAKDLAPIVNIDLISSKGSTTCRTLVDSGASSTVLSREKAELFQIYSKEQSHILTTVAGKVQNNLSTTIIFKLPQFSPTLEIEWECDVIEDMSRLPYDMIIGRDVMRVLQMDVLSSDLTISMGDIKIPWASRNANKSTLFNSESELEEKDSADRLKKILDAKYEPANLEELVGNSKLSPDQKIGLLHLLQKYEDLFDGSLGTFQMDSYNIELAEGAKPYHLKRAYTVPQAYLKTVKLEVERLCKLGILEKINDSEWAAGTFIIPKKDGTVRFISDFRELNKRIKRKPYPIPKIQELMLMLEGFMFATSLDLNMGYYHIVLTPQSRNLCTILLPWGKYRYIRLPMGLKNSPDIFQEKMSNLMAGLEYVRTYIDDMLVITNSIDSMSESEAWKLHLQQLNRVFQRLQRAGLKVNAKKSFFGRQQLEYLGYWVTREGIQPIPKKVQAIVNLEPPKTRREVRKFIGMVNFYRDMWRKRSALLAPLTRLVSKNAKFAWTDVEQKAFDDIKRVLGRETLLAYPQFDKPFVIHTDASNTQLGAVISQEGQPIAFYSRKLSPAQQRYTTTEQELLSIVETLKEFRNILLGHQITVYTDHRNLTYKNFNTNRVMRWRLAIEEYGPELIYIKGEKNVVADALSRLATKDESNNNLEFISDQFGFDDQDLPANMYPLKFSTIARYQEQDKSLMEKLTHDNKYRLTSFHGGENKEIDLITKDEKIVIPEALQERIVQWYHTFLCHPGENRTELSIRQHFTFKGMRPLIKKICSKCSVCQKSKKHTQKYGHLPEKTAETNPWTTLCVDLIGPYTVTGKHGRKFTLWCCTMIDPATGWVEIKEIDQKSADEIINVVDQAWLSRYPWPSIVISDRGGEFMKEFSSSLEEYGITKRTITTRNPQANAILERVHQTIGNIIRTFSFEDLEEEDPWSGIISAVAFSIRATVSTTTEKSPMQLIFGRDAILNIKHTADWQRIQQRKQKLINQNNIQENAKRIKHTYSVGNKILVKTDYNKAKYDPEYNGPYTIVQVNDNGTVKYRNGAILDTINIRQIHPYKE